MESVNFRIKNKVLYVLSSELIKSCNISSMDRINSYKENVPNCEITQKYINYYTTDANIIFIVNCLNINILNWLWL